MIVFYASDSELPMDNALIGATLQLAIEEANRRYENIRFILNLKYGKHWLSVILLIKKINLIYLIIMISFVGLRKWDLFAK